MSKIRKGDEVVVIAGRDRSRRGTVARVLDDGRIVVEGLNMVKKHQRPNPQRGVAGGIIEKEMPLDRSNVMLWNPASKKPGRVGYKFVGEGAARKKVRVFKAGGDVVDR